jgi:CheY-like chemotaxis protein/HPt (histidine-containing phosphotransfer) domain-containing protein
MCTSLGQLANDQHWGKVGFVAALTKPVRRPELLEVLNSALHGKQAAALTNAKPAFASGQAFSPARILVVEDNITNQQVAVSILQRLGLRATVAANGAEAVRALETIPYDLVLMDVQMPVMDGLAATRQIRDPQTRVLNHQVPIIAMTAHAVRGDREKCLQAGMNDYVTKPVEVSSLVAALERCLNPSGEPSRSPEGNAKEEVAVSKPRKEVPIFDRAALMNRVMHDKELAQTVIVGFLEDLPGQITRLKSHAAAGQAHDVGLQAHKIKGASATVGGEALRAVAYALERAGKAGDLAIISKRMGELDTQFAALKDAMNHEI